MIEVEGFKKTFYVGFRRKPFQAVREISFSVQQGEIFGFLGPNGSGKTTTIKALLDLIRPDAGKLSLLGHPSSSMAWRSGVGYLPEHPTFYDYLTALELVSWFGKLAGIADPVAEATRQLERVGLGYAMKRRLRSYSKGMLQRAGLAQALVGSPKLLILDEPMTGLDPMGRKEVRDLILELRDEGCTIFYSTHILPDVEMTCDRVAIIEKGKLKTIGRLQDIMDETTSGVSVVLSGLDEAKMNAFVAEHPGSMIRERKIQIEVATLQEARAITADAVAKGASLDKFEPHRDDLETIFVKSLRTPTSEESS